ncbi:MAG: iron chelate uptake ABC transporter family permease subunit, partial [Clostridia bacterium]|nr:iron chelate uptake ABC transporter family permease subunit [Clostridia bacterium]
MARSKTVFALLLCTLLAAALLSLCVGAVPVAPGDILGALLRGERETVGARIVLYTRLPRTAAALLSGCALAVAGAVIQTVLCNPLAAPNIIGVNASAGLAVAVACAMTPMSAVSTPLI